ncbi:class I SAM-dependent methyltransferase [Methylobacterium terrae]|uniref:class I SAM-dependent methyltransferase n=1 Tax=Methylobacterium terrae TaxID=2202827 RepID=UPI0013A5BBB8|nr:class I SAM-dependent methyltransferase [Methylobacterium terrae]
MTNDLHRLFQNVHARSRRVHKWHHYFDIYEKYFSEYRDREIVFLEIGVFEGGSLELWRKYFGNKARIIGVDINPACLQFQEPDIEIVIGDQSDPEFLKDLVNRVGPIDIVLDDGGHTANQQITTFEYLYHNVKVPGIYLVEDTHTAFWGGGYSDRQDQKSFMDFAFERCRSLHEWTMRQSAFWHLGTPPTLREPGKIPVSDFCRLTNSISFYDSVVVFERALREEPWHEIR